MKSSFILTFLLLVLTTQLISAQSTGNSQLIFERVKARFPFEKASVDYVISGDASGKSNLTFDRNGWRSKEIRTIKFTRYGIESNESRLEQKDGDQLYKADLIGLKGTQNKENTLMSLLAYKEQEESRRLYYESKGGTLIGQDTVLNYVCNKWEFSRGTVNTLWEYEGLPLRATHKLPGFTFTQEIVAIKKDIIVKPDFWKLPEGITWR